MQTQSQPFHDSRGGLQRRQTTDLGKMAGITPIGQQPTQAVDPLDLSMVCTSDSQQSQSFFEVLPRCPNWELICFKAFTWCTYLLLVKQFADYHFTLDFSHGPACKQTFSSV